MNSVIVRVLVGSLAWAAFAQEPSSKGVNFYSLAREVQLGQEAAAALERALPVVHEPKLDAYIAELGSELAKYADPQFVYTFALYDDRKPVAVQPMAMAMPGDAFSADPGEPVAFAGGRVLVPLGLLASAPNEAVFAFQLAHAMAHISLRHSARLASRQQLATMLTKGLEAQKSSFPGQLPASQAGFMSFTFTRQFELQADSEAVRIMAAAGYNPEAAIQYLGDQSPPAQTSDLASMHPTSSQRVETVRSALGSLLARAYSPASGRFAEAKALAASVR
jgi:predicted Zn-dependent protease